MCVLVKEFKRVCAKLSNYVGKLPAKVLFVEHNMH